MAVGLNIVDQDSSLNALAQTLFNGMTEVSAFNRIGVIVSSTFADSPVSIQVIFHTVGSVVLFVIAWLTFEVFNREQQTVTPARGLLPRVSLKRSGQRSGRQRAWSNYALVWKDFQFLAGGRWLSLIKLAAYLAACGLFIGLGMGMNPRTL